MGAAQRGQSEVLGGILLAGIVVLAASAFSVAYFATISADGGPAVEVVGDATRDTLFLDHTAGESVSTASLRVVWRNASTADSIDFENGSLTGTDATFDPGDRWTAPPFPDGGQFAANESVALYLIHEPSDKVLYSGTRRT